VDFVRWEGEKEEGRRGEIRSYRPLTSVYFFFSRCTYDLSSGAARDRSERVCQLAPAHHPRKDISKTKAFTLGSKA
jgi:hypothetical protein